MSDSLTFIAKLTARPGAENQLAEALAGIVAPTRKEAGCLAYFPHRSTDNPSTFLIYESWKAEADFVAHCETPHFQAVGARLPELLAGPPSREVLSPLF